jgi:hypothetical protein
VDRDRTGGVMDQIMQVTQTILLIVVLLLLVLRR